MNGQDHNCPFLGPRPFEEQDAPRFFGRREEVDELLKAVEAQRLTILTAGSGAGKTSLLQAGFIPALRVLRERGSSPRRGLVLCVRDWHVQREKSVARAIVVSIEAEIKRLRAACRKNELPGRAHLLVDLAELPTDLSADDTTPPGSPEEHEWFVSCIERLCDKVPGQELLLIIDQAEELLGSATPATAEVEGPLALRLLGSTFETERRLRLLLSIRKEYREDLRPLDVVVGDLARRAHYLLSLTASAFRQAVYDHKVITARALDQVLSWAAEPHDVEDYRPIDALATQSLLMDIWLHRKDEYRGSPIDETRLQTYQQDMERQFHSEKTAGKLAEHAMFRHVDRALRQCDEIESIRAGMIKRAAARMGSLLSSPRGFKRHITDVDLVLKAMREDLRSPALASELNRAEFEKSLPALRAEEHGTARADPSPPSGLADDAKDKANLLARAAFAAIDRLTAGYVLKYHGTGDGGQGLYALQHDLFGSAFDLWGEMFRDRIDDALASPIGCFGTYIAGGARLAPDSSPGAAKTRKEEKLNWIGCRLDGVEFEHTHFEDCDFSGSSFKGCRFSGCVFTRCRLPAVVLDACKLDDSTFRDCEAQGASVLGGTWDGVRLKRCDASGLFVGANCAWTGIELENVTLNSAVIREVALKGTLNMYECTMHYARVEAFKNFEKERLVLRRCSLHGALVADFAALPDEMRKENHVPDSEAITKAPPRS